MAKSSPSSKPSPTPTPAATASVADASGDTWRADAGDKRSQQTTNVDLAELTDRAGSEPPAVVEAAIERMVAREWLSRHGAHVAATAAGTRVLDRVMAEIWD